MKSTISKRSIIIAGRRTSVSLEDAFWNALREIAVGRGATLSDLVASTDVAREAPQSVISHSAFCARRLSRSDPCSEDDAPYGS